MDISEVSPEPPQISAVLPRDVEQSMLYTLPVYLWRNTERKIKKSTWHLLDLEKAFDQVPHDMIWSALRSHQILEAYVRLTQFLYQDTIIVVHCPVGIMPAFHVSVGVYQGSALSPFLFILCMDTAKADIQSTHPWTLLYDDVLLANEERPTLNNQVKQWKDWLNEEGLLLNLKRRDSYAPMGAWVDSIVSGPEWGRTENSRSGPNQWEDEWSTSLLVWPCRPQRRRISCRTSIAPEPRWTTSTRSIQRRGGWTGSSETWNNSILPPRMP